MRCFFMKRLKILIVKVAEFGNPSTKNIDRQRYIIQIKSNQTLFQYHKVHTIDKNTSKDKTKMILRTPSKGQEDLK